MGTRENFEAHKISRAIKTSGEVFKFYRLSKNAYGEPVEPLTDVATVEGLYHTNVSHLTVSNTDSGSQTSRKVYTPAILCLADEASKSIRKNDFVKIGEKTCQVTGIIDYQDKGYAFDVCCEVIKDGRESV